MVRKQEKAPSTSRSSSKRAAPDKSTPTRQSKRTRTTVAKTSYAEPESDEDIGSEDAGDPLASDFEDEESKEPSSASDHAEASSEEDVKPKVPQKGRPTKRTTLPSHKKQTKQTNEEELWKDGAKLAPGTQLIIKKPKAREAGDIPYLDHTIHPNTMLFLKDLAANNDRQWLKSTFPSLHTSVTQLAQ